jgi:D-inositol-3-phosphate glycosyltransferase
MKRIALVVPALAEEGGVPSVARFIKEIIERSGEFKLKLISLATSAHDLNSVRIGSPMSWLRGVQTREGEWGGQPFVHVGANWSELEFQRFLPRARLTAELADCDLIQVVCGCPAWGLSAMRSGRPVVLQVATRAALERRRRGTIERGPKAAWRSMMTQITKRLDDNALGLADAILVENKWMFEYASLMSSRRGSMVRYAPPGIDSAMFRPQRAEHPEPDYSDYIFSVGRFDDPRKNVSLLLEAFALMKQGVQHPCRLKLAGSRDPGVAFWRRARELRVHELISFHHLPTQDELVKLYQGAMCFALSSDEEGFGLVITEAMACGIPVVATRCGGPDGIIRNEIDGYLVPLNDATAMASRLGRLLLYPEERRAMGFEARKSVEERFSYDAAGAMYLDTYRMLLTAS